MSTRLLVVHHTVSPATQRLLEAVLDGTRAEGLEDVEVDAVPALVAGPTHVLAADGVVLGTPANIGYMSGALKHFFDQVFYPCQGATAGLPWGCWIHGNDDTAGARRGIESITGGMGWRSVADPVEVVDQPGRDDLDALWNLGATVAAATLEH